MKLVIWNGACLGKLLIVHCILIQVILCERATRAFLADTGKKILSSIIVKARKVSVLSLFHVVSHEVSLTQLTCCVVCRAQRDLRRCLKK